MFTSTRGHPYTGSPVRLLPRTMPLLVFLLQLQQLPLRTHSAAASRGAAHSHLPEILLCEAGSSHGTTAFTLPAPDGPPRPIALKNSTACATVGKGHTDRCCLVAAGATGVQGIATGNVLTCDPHGLGCMTLGACGTAPTFSWGAGPTAHHLVAAVGGEQWCLDAFGDGPRRDYARRLGQPHGAGHD